MAGSCKTDINEEITMELEALKAIYEEEFSQIAENLFEFRSKEETVLRMFLTDNYPHDIPVIEVLLIGNSEASDDLHHHLVDTARTCVGNVMMHKLIEETNEWLAKNPPSDHSQPGNVACQFFLEGRCRFGDKCLNLHLEETTNSTADSMKSMKEVTASVPSEVKCLEREQNKKKRNSSHENEKDTTSVNTKKSRMKTAVEVINRIIWDEQIPSKYMTVGYLDRFIGVIEKPFADFSWEDIASVDNTVLAIPKHRIQYFKYCEEIVWDKNHRLDKVFGSTGDSETILDVVKRVQSPVSSPDEKAEYVLPLAAVNSTRDDKSPGLMKARSGPNYFIALRITDPCVLAAIKDFQKEVLSIYSSLVNSMTPLPSIHLTLCTLKLDSDDKVDLAGQILRELQPVLWSFLRPSDPVFLSGLGSFHGRVLYASVDHHPGLDQYMDVLKTRLQEVGLNLEGTRDDANTHVTIMKSRGAPSAIEDILTRFKNTSFGPQFFQSVHLCSMTDAKEEDGFHRCVKTVRNSLDAVASSLSQKLTQHVQQMNQKEQISDEVEKELVSKFTSGDSQLENQALIKLETLNKTSTNINGVVIILRGVTGSGKTHLITSSLEYQQDPGSFVLCDPKSLYQKSGICCLDPTDRAVGEFNSRVQFMEGLSRKVPIVVIEGVFSRCWEYEFYKYVGKLFGYEIRVIEIPCLDETTLNKYYKRRMGTSFPWQQVLMSWRGWEQDRTSVQVSHELLKSSTRLVKIVDLPEGVLPLPVEAMHEADQHYDAETKERDFERIEGQVVQDDGHISTQYVPLPQRAPRNNRRQRRSKESKTQQVVENSLPLVSEPCQLLPSQQETNTDEGERKSLLLDPLHIYTGPTTIKSLFIFDFDMTLFLTPRNGEGQQEYRKLAGTMWPFPGWMGRPESLQSPFRVTPGPALEQYRVHYSRACSYTVILTGRSKSCENAVREVLFSNDVFPHRLICKPTHLRGSKRTTVYDYKRDVVQKLLKEFSDVTLVKLWDDRTDNVTAFEKEAEQHPHIKFEIFNVGVPPKMKPRKMPTKSKEANKRPPVHRVKTFLQSQGLCSADIKKSYVVNVQNYLRDLWEVIVRSFGVEEVKNCCYLMNTQSTDFHQDNRIQVCLLIQPGLDLTRCLGSFCTELRSRGHRLCYVDPSSCLKLVIGMEFLEFPRINCHVYFGFVSKESPLISERLPESEPAILSRLLSKDIDRNQEVMRILQQYHLETFDLNETTSYLVLMMVHLVFKSQNLLHYGYLTDSTLRNWLVAYFNRHTRSMGTCNVEMKTAHPQGNLTNPRTDTAHSQGNSADPRTETTQSVDKLFRQFLLWICSIPCDLKGSLPQQFVEYMREKLAVVKEVLEAEKGLTPKVLSRLADCRHTKTEQGNIARITHSSGEENAGWRVREYLSHCLPQDLQQLFENGVQASFEYPQNFTEMALKLHSPDNNLKMIEDVMMPLILKLQDLVREMDVKVEMVLHKT